MNSKNKFIVGVAFCFVMVFFGIVFMVSAEPDNAEADIILKEEEQVWNQVIQHYFKPTFWDRTSKAQSVEI